MTYTVSQFNAAISSYLSEGLGTVSVRGEVVDLKIAKDRLVFFDLKDAAARVGCFMMRWELPEGIRDGMEVEIAARAGLFKQSGRFHLRVITVVPVGDGALAAALRQLKEKLEREGLFAAERKRPIPRFPQTIGIVTSAQAAAFTDIVRILNNRWGNISVVLSPAAVQGAAAAAEIVLALERLNSRPDIDVIIVTRGGGAAEELNAFNSESVARAIFASRVPVVSAVGHERDTTIADLVADLRASTPSNAAERVVCDRRETLVLLDHFTEVMHQALHRQVERSHHTLETFVRTGEFWFAGLVERLEHARSLLEHLNPQAILQRGFSITKDHTGAIVRSVKAIHCGDVIRTTVSDGQIVSEVIR
ncbi:exodeoxyribonuclease VII large subunit [Candidatus Uhrbacteria bacterium]|nr:exodeoxyribonuclease VII large subunit [Candidatus Uhrbacteria bacterium]